MNLFKRHSKNIYVVGFDEDSELESKLTAVIKDIMKKSTTTKVFTNFKK